MKMLLLYATITEMNSDFNGKDIKYYTKTIKTYSCLSEDFIPSGLRNLENLGVIEIIEEKENGKFKGKRLVFSPENVKEITERVPPKTAPGKSAYGKAVNDFKDSSEDSSTQEDILGIESISHSNASVADNIIYSSAEDSRAEKGKNTDNSEINGDDVNKAIKIFKLINPTGFQSFFKNKTQRNAAVKLSKVMNAASLSHCLNLLSLSYKCERKSSDLKNIAFAPRVRNPKELLDKLENVRDYYFRIKKSLEEKYGHRSEDVNQLLEFELGDLTRQEN